ncbi:MAG: hypothetical protein HKO75_09865 [Flavobacteriaceae bacterium]|nr:hypothetical protein [Muriicola sp.]MBT8291118.1 hypothetical protein [Muriicola sp.]NNK36317.1 hypothetical protein [Eudoraea sp.]NNL40154.1 hypothetical protein [Flavobacteriaceae bacterium]
MDLKKMIKQIQNSIDQSASTDFKKYSSRLLNLLEEVDSKNLSDVQKLKLQTSISSYLENIKTEKEVKRGLKKLKHALINKLGFVTSDYYLTLGIGIGVAIGTSLGVSFGIPFENGIVYGPMVGVSIGIIGGLIVGKIMDKKKEEENMVLKNL